MPPCPQMVCILWLVLYKGASFLSPVRAFRVYIECSSRFWQSEQLFVWFRGCSKGLPVTKQRLSHCIVYAIALAYASVGLWCPIGVRPPREWLPSWAWSSGVSIGDSCATAGWSSPSNFARFYNLDACPSGMDFVCLTVSWPCWWSGQFVWGPWPGLLRPLLAHVTLGSSARVL